MLEYENAKRYRASSLLCRFTFCSKSLEIPMIFSLFAQKAYTDCDIIHSFFALIITEKRKSATMLQDDT